MSAPGGGLPTPEATRRQALTRLSDMQRQLDELVAVIRAQQRTIAALERIIGATVRMVDPTAAQLSREDRDQIVAYARSTRDAITPGSTGDG